VRRVASRLLLSLVACCVDTLLFRRRKHHRDTVLHRLVLCGSIVRRDFPWYDLGNQLPPVVINECGSKDMWPPVASFLSSAFGASGTFGFDSPRIRNRFHEHAHGGALTPAFVESFWKPYFLSGKFVSSEWETKRPPTLWILQQLARVRLSSVVLLIVIVVVLRFAFQLL